MKNNKFTKETVDEISTQFNELKNTLLQNKTSANKEEVEATLEKLDALNTEIQKQYSEISVARDKAEPHLPEIEKNIYTNIESFHNAFTKAGSLLKRQ